MNVRTFDRLVKLKFSVFMLPFTLAGAFLPLAMGVEMGPLSRLVWVAIGFFGARFGGHALNDLIDREIDAKNPRTEGRVLPTGATTPRQALMVGVLGLLIFGYACARLNALVLTLAVPTGLLIWGYPFTKRFTCFCHFVVGLVCLMGPVMAWAAMTGTLAWPPVLLGACALCTIVANDVVWALQDFKFDTEYGLHSVPVRIGPAMTLMLSRLLYSGAVLCLAAAGLMANLAWPFYIGVLGALAAVIYYDRVLLRRGEEGIPAAFFRCNAVVAASSLLAVLLALF